MERTEITRTCRLEPLRRLMALLRLSNGDVARVLGVTANDVSYFLCKDDTKLSKIEKVAEAYGYVVDVSISDRRIPGRVFDLVRWSGNVQRKRLFLLKEVMRAAGINDTAISQTLGVSPKNIREWWAKDDLNVSRIYALADAFGKKVFWTIRPAEKEPEMEPEMKIEFKNH